MGGRVDAIHITDRSGGPMESRERARLRAGVGKAAIGRPILRDLAHRAGLRASILSDGEIAVGDPVRPV